MHECDDVKQNRTKTKELLQLAFNPIQQNHLNYSQRSKLITYSKTHPLIHQIINLLAVTWFPWDTKFIDDLVLTWTLT